MVYIIIDRIYLKTERDNRMMKFEISLPKYFFEPINESFKFASHIL